METGCKGDAARRRDAGGRRITGGARTTIWELDVGVKVGSEGRSRAAATPERWPGGGFGALGYCDRMNSSRMHDK